MELKLWKWNIEDVAMIPKSVLFNLILHHENLLTYPEVCLLTLSFNKVCVWAFVSVSQHFWPTLKYPNN